MVRSVWVYTLKAHPVSFLSVTNTVFDLIQVLDPCKMKQQVLKSNLNTMLFSDDPFS